MRYIGNGLNMGKRGKRSLQLVHVVLMGGGIAARHHRKYPLLMMAISVSVSRQIWVGSKMYLVYAVVWILFLPGCHDWNEDSQEQTWKGRNTGKILRGPFQSCAFGFTSLREILWGFGCSSSGFSLWYRPRDVRFSWQKQRIRSSISFSRRRRGTAPSSPLLSDSSHFN